MGGCTRQTDGLQSFSPYHFRNVRQMTIIIEAARTFAEENPDAEVITGGRFDLNNYA